ncbi:MAG: sugar phosphate isomerase/epimerase [Treponema sp.]|jgi:protein FrlC|nr:sugar phosphate isomerase/epimerase [Treponema sp.]
MKYAFNTCAFGSNNAWLPAYPLDETMKRLARIGYKAIEVVCASPHAWPEFLSEEDITRIGAWQKEYGINIVSLMPLMGGGGPGNNVASACKEELEWSRGYYKSCVDLAARWGAKTISYGAGWVSVGSTPVEAKKIALDSLIQIGKHAQEKNVTICIDPSSELTEVVDTVDQALAMMKESGLPNVKVMFDMAFCFSYLLDPADVVLQIGSNLGHVQLCDRNRSAPGDGGYDFYPVIQALKDISYDGYLTFEIGFSRSSQPTSMARKALLYMQEIEKKTK